jgi:hypothetical protein
MGADEESQTKSEAIELPNQMIDSSVLSKLNDGWELKCREGDGQLLLVPPSRYGDAA